SPPTDYAYHFDAGLLGQFLKSHALKLGIKHRIGTVAEVLRQENGDISGLRLNGSDEILTGSLFIDCSGFQGLLINQALGVPFESFADNLFNDRAIAMPTALDEGQDIPSQTRSTALRHGWAWQIPLTNRFGNGYVYASAFVSAEEAEQELREHLGPAAQDSEARHLKMRVGQVSEHWRNNCLAIGLSQGFIEPLEATALMLIQFSLDHFIAALEHAHFGRAGQAGFNARTRQMFEGVRDYVVGHYQLNSRDDTEYWRANRANRKISARLASILEVWDCGADFEAELTRHGEALMYIRPSWYCLLAGMGRFPGGLQLAPPSGLISGAQARSALAAKAGEFWGHRAYLQQHAAADTQPH
ncbi:MAG: tryptophan 7-halogenase, partial [Burkholderiaceae bacterium]|nr:tryptophan 7-halogenase [Burkholderiaceae bacterium]